MERCDSTNSSMVGAKKRGSAQSGLIERAAIIIVAFGIAHILGLRQMVSALLEGAQSSLLERVGCSAYLFLYGCAVFVAPVLLIAAILLLIWDRVRRGAPGC